MRPRSACRAGARIARWSAPAAPTPALVSLPCWTLRARSRACVCAVCAVYLCVLAQMRDAQRASVVGTHDVAGASEAPRFLARAYRTPCHVVHVCVSLSWSHAWSHDATPYQRAGSAALPLSRTRCRSIQFTILALRNGTCNLIESRSTVAVAQRTMKGQESTLARRSRGFSPRAGPARSDF